MSSATTTAVEVPRPSPRPAQNSAIAIEELSRQFALHIEQAEVRNKRIDSLTKELKIYNRGGLPSWLLLVLIGMGISHIGTIVSLFYIIPVVTRIHH